MEGTLGVAGSWWEMQRDWNCCELHHDQLLRITFEELKADLSGCIKRIAQFLGVACSQDLLHAIEGSSRLIMFHC